MKNILPLLAVFLVSIIPVNAQEDAGITPDSIFWTLDVAFDNLALSLAGDDDKIEKGLEIAEERLEEIKVMANKNKIEVMVKAETEHGIIVNKVKEEIDKAESDDSNLEARRLIEIEKNLLESEVGLRELKQILQLEIRGDLTEQQKAIIDSLVNNLDNQAQNLRIKVESNKNKVKIKIKSETGKSEIEIEEEFEGLEREIKGDEQELEIEARIFGNKAQARIELEFESDIVDEDQLAEEIVKKLTLTEETVASLLDVKVEEELEEDKFIIKAEIEEGSEIEIEIRFTVDSIKREDIINAIIEKAILTKEEVKDVWELKVEAEEVEEEIDEATEEENETENEDEDNSDEDDNDNDDNDDNGDEDDDGDEEGDDDNGGY